MKRIFTFLFCCVSVFALKAQDAQNTMICNFDDVYPDVSAWGDVSLVTAPAPDGTLASGTMGVLTINADNENGSMIIQLDSPFDPRDYVGISLVAQIPDANGLNPAFIFKLGVSSDDPTNKIHQIQDWTYNVSYSGSGEWEEIHLPFSDNIFSALDQAIADNPGLTTDQYDIIELAPGAWNNKPDFTMNVDNIMLRTSWDETGIPLTKLAAIVLTSANGTISAVGGNNTPVSLKVYSISGQEIANGVNQVQIETKGAYIVKAATGNANLVQKIIVK